MPPSRAISDTRSVHRHPNTVRTQLHTLTNAGLLEHRIVRQVRGRPRDTWAIVPGAALSGAPPQAYRQLSLWLARALVGAGLDEVESAGRQIGHELAPEPSAQAVGESMTDARQRSGSPLARRCCPPGVCASCSATAPTAKRCRRTSRPSAPSIGASRLGCSIGSIQAQASPRFAPKDPCEAGCIIELAVARS